MEFHTHASIREFSEAEWSEVLGHDPEPYLRYAFLEAFESTGCVRPEVGWAPLFISLREGGRILAVAPGYVKGHSDGEFVFDHGWAEFAETRLGIPYYPKLIVACPFTPATGRRLVCAPGTDVAALTRVFVAGLCRLVRELELSSAHVLFPRAEEAERLESAGLLSRLGLQYHWRNAGYQTFDDFLARYDSKRRNQVKRERRELEKQGIELVVHAGSDIEPWVVDHAFDFYGATVSKYFWGRRYLNRAFFEEVCARMPEQICVVLAHQRASGRVLGGAFNLVGNGRMFGRYWGAREEVRFLHFNVCYYQGIEECIRRGLDVFEPGAGGEHKIVRGFEPTFTHSAHWLEEQRLRAAIADFSRRERRVVALRRDAEPSVLRPLAASEKKEPAR